MSKTLDYTEVKTSIESDVSRIVFLRSSSLFVLLAAIESVGYRSQWSNESVELSDMQWDIAESWVDNAVYDLLGGVMLGAIMPFCRVDSMPEGFLLCDGTEYDKDDYPLLYAVLPDDMKTETTFVVPDLTDKFLMGGIADDCSVEGGETAHTLTESEMPNHRHHVYIAGDLDVEGVGVPQPNAAQISPIAVVATTYVGGDGAHENRPPFFTVVFGIAAW